MITIFILVANQVAVQCLGVNCEQINYRLINDLVKLGLLELIFEVYGFIRIYVRRDRNTKE